MSGLGWTFDTVAADYEKLRPGYPKELYDTLFDYLPVHENTIAAEIGIGGGQATLPILQTGCRVTAVDRGENFAALLKEKFRAYPGFSVITGKFEDISFEDGSFDLVYAASSFHWIDEAVGYGKVYAMLKEGGVFARFANHPCRDKKDPGLSADIDRLYAEYYDTYHHRTSGPPPEYTPQMAKERAETALKYGFRDIRYALFRRERVFTAKEYTALLGTYSDHIAIEESIRREFFTAIGDAIDRHGGYLTLSDTIDLELCRK